MYSGREKFDVAVVGAGPAGSAAARWLAMRGYQVALIERSRFLEPRLGESLAPEVQPLLMQLGVWQDFQRLRPLASYGTRSIWGAETPEEHSHLVSPWGCGWHVERRALDRMLAEAARSAGAMLLCGTTLNKADETGDGWALTLTECSEENSENHMGELHASVVMDATGRAACLGRRVGAQRDLFDHLIAVAVQIDGIRTEHECHVMVESSADGWWYSAPLPADRMMVMFMTDADVCGRSVLASVFGWSLQLKTAPTTQKRVAGKRLLWGPRVCCATSQRLRRYEWSLPWLAIGDAALAVDPISGSGVVRALRSALVGADAAVALLSDRSSRVIETYEAHCDVDCSNYLDERSAYYRIERRWVESLFWKRRVAPGVDESIS
jgi:flavin-dependent dehydrogenase